MSDVVGSGEHRYDVVEGWAKLPDGWEFKDVGAVAVDSKDHVYVFNRGEHPMMVFDRDGQFPALMGRRPVSARARPAHRRARHALPDRRRRPHGAQVHHRRQGAARASALPGKPAPYMSGEPFHRCTHTALSPKGEIYVSDGYGNARVHKYSPDGKLLMSWGEPGTDPGQFNIVHNIVYRSRTAGSTSPTARTIACRCSTATASTRRSGTTCTGRAASTAHAAPASSRSSSSASWARAWRSTAALRTSARASASSTTRASASRGSAARTARVSRPASSSRRTASRSTRAATSIVGEVAYTDWPQIAPRRADAQSTALAAEAGARGVKRKSERDQDAVMGRKTPRPIAIRIGLHAIVLHAEVDLIL